jgi:DNA-binding beta-propeller fold protein YncE
MLGPLLRVAFGAVLVSSCSSSTDRSKPATSKDSGAQGDGSTSRAHLPLVLVSDVDLPGGATRFDYQDVDHDLGHLVMSHMNDGSVLFVTLSDGAVLKEITGIPVARGVAVASDVGLVFVTSSPSSLVIIDSKTMMEKTRVSTGNGPDGVGWDPTDKVVGVSDQGDGAMSLIPESGNGTRKQVKLGTATGNVVFDASRGWFWIAVEAATPPDQLVAVDPVTADVKSTIGLPGCSAAHGVRMHPDGKTAFVACEANSTLARVDLDGASVIGTDSTGAVPDVMSIDPELGWIYVAAESADLTVFDVNEPGVALIGHDKPGDASHTVALDPKTHHVFFPLQVGPNGTPVLRIMKPGGI